MDHYEQFRRAAIDRGISNDEIDKFTDHLRFAICLGSPGHDEQVVGQRGGLPRLPVGAEWPSDKRGNPLPFIASVDCAVLPRVGRLPLPEDGSLLFFLHHEDDLLAPLGTDVPEFARVVHVPAGAETAVASPPPGHDSTTPFHENIPFLAPEGPLSAWVQPELPEWIEEDDYDFDELDSAIEEQLLDELEHVEDLCELVDELWPDADGNLVITIGGYCSEIGGQDDPWTQMARAGITSRRDDSDFPGSERFYPGEVEKYRLTREWLPLAQFGTRSEVHHGCFLISRDDLADKRFDRTLSFTMFTE
ncbi:YwqG family protein [Actinosynnema sp. NPDC023587]|uniref:YwqG family protein n=1 Tax=Actinosynnema sp. NPDC023587 TaxID=3154695 RepID=UPI0034118B3A